MFLQKSNFCEYIFTEEAKLQYIADVKLELAHCVHLLLPQTLEFIIKLAEQVGSTFQWATDCALR